MRMKTIAILNLKGGTAKTVTAATMARCLTAEHNKQVVLIDADQQGTCLSISASRTPASAATPGPC